MRQNWRYQFSRWLGKRLIGEVIGSENVPSELPFFVAANHNSYFDPWAIGSAATNQDQIIYWLAKKETADGYLLAFDLVELPGLRWWWVARIVSAVMAWIIRGSYIIPVDREHLSSKINRRIWPNVKRVLKAGQVVGIFPEGGMNRLGENKEGAGKFAIKANQDSEILSPVLIVPIFRRGRKVMIGPSIDPREFSNPKELTTRIIQAIYDLDR